MPRSIENLPDAAERGEKHAEAAELNRLGAARVKTIGVIHNNPGELSFSRRFKGMNPNREHQRLGTFEHSVWGIRALAITLKEGGERGDLLAATKAVIRAKCGRDVYSDEEIGQGVRLAG